MNDSQDPGPQDTRRGPESSDGPASRYHMLRLLGAGGMGDVHLAEDQKLPRQVALKTIKAELCRDAEIVKRIDRECKLHAKIGTHPNIVTLHDRIEDPGGRISLVMEYVPGETLHQFIERNAAEGRRLEWQQAIRIVAQVLDALGRIHAHGIVHRDIKPGNIMLAQDDHGRFTAKLMDFGIARLQVEEEGFTHLTREGGSGPGTPLYMAPEQIDPKAFGEITSATDIYAAGALLYQIVAGRPPFGGSLTEIFNGHLNAAPPPIAPEAGRNVPDALLAILRRALAKRPGDRFASAREFREALETLPDPESGDRTVVSTGGAFDPSRTLAATDPGGGIEKGQTLLDTTGVKGRPRNRTARTLAILAAIFLVWVSGLGAAGYYFFLRPAPDAASVAAEPRDRTDPGPAETPATEPGPAGMGHEELPLAEAAQPLELNGPAMLEDGAPAMAIAPDAVAIETAQDHGLALDPADGPAAPEAGGGALDAFTAARPSPAPPPSQQHGPTALEELLDRLGGNGAEADEPPAAAPAPRRTPAPRQQTPARTQAPPERPAAPQPPPATSVQDAWADSPVTRIEDRKLPD